MDAPEIVLGKATATLVRASPLAVLALTRQPQEFESAGAPLLLGLGAGALACCWPEDRAWPARHRPRKWRLGQRIEDYGQEVFDALAEADGVDLSALIGACGTAYRWALAGLVNAEELQAAEGFSAARTAG